MPEGRPKLLVITGPRVHAAEISAALGPHFDVRCVDPRRALDEIKSGRYQVIMAESDDFLPLERELVGQQSNMLLSALGEGVCLADGEGRVVWSNPRFSGYDSQLAARIGAVCRQAVRWMAEQSPENPQDGRNSPRGRRYDVASADGSRSYEVMVSPVVEGPADMAGGFVPRHVAAVVWDVTPVRRQQQKQAAIDSAGAELVRLDAEAIRKLHTGDRLRVLEEKIVRFAHDLLSFDHFAIRLIDERSNKLELVMSRGLPSAAMEVELLARREGNGISGFVAATGRSYICHDTNTDPRYVIGIEGCRSSLTIPLVMHGKTIGIFNVESSKPNAFTEEDRQYGEAFANHIALALHMLNLLVVERVETGQTVGHTVEDELKGPIAELSADIARLKKLSAGFDPAFVRLLDRVIGEVESLQRRVKDVTSGPQTVLGSEKALSDATVDPVIVGKRILVADDEPRIRQIIRDVLRSRGADVVICENGETAIAALTKIGPAGLSPAGPGNERSVGPSASGPSGPVRYDLLISDIKLPDRTGYEIFAEARKVHPTLPVILMTGFGYDPHHSIVRASQEGLQCVLFKPFQAERLIEEVHKALDKKL